MKRTIKSRVILSYMVVALITLVFVGVFFNFAVQRYVENQARKDLLNDAKIIGETFRNNRSLVDENPGKLTELLREAVKVNRMGLETQGAVIVKDLKGTVRIAYPRNGIEGSETFYDNILPSVEEELNIKNDRYLRIKTKKGKYFGVIHPIPVKADIRARFKVFLVLYIEASQVKELTRGMVFTLTVSLAFSALVALILGIIFARSIARPVVMLKSRAEKLSGRDFDSKVRINTGDELEELANTINKMAMELKEYDIAQKRFLQNASHELKTPLMSIQGYAEGLKDGVFENQEEALDIIAEETVRLKGIVEDLIFLSKLETMEDFYRFGTESINGIIGKSVEKVNSIALGKEIRINTMLYRDAQINCDRLKMIQALINILGNCIRHAGSEIDIITSNEGEWFEMKIYDDGEGFREEELNKIFDRFHKGEKGDTGLGMAITKAIIEKHGGSIRAQNRQEGGAEFVVRLPAV